MTADADYLTEVCRDLLDALECARRQLVRLGGECRIATDDDQIQAQVLSVIDCALAKATRIET